MKSAIANGRSIPISTKKSIEICNWIRGRKVDNVIRSLDDVAIMKKAIPYTRFTGGAAHKPGIGPGKYPLKTAAEINNVVKSAKANAVFKGLDTDKLVITIAMANRASVPVKYGRHSGRERKRSHVTIEVSEKQEVKKETKKEVKKVSEDKK